MTSLIDKIEQLIKREKTTPDRKIKDEKSKSSSEILSELFSAFNADPPKIEDIPSKKSKKSKKKHKKEKKKRSRSCSSSSDSDDSEYSHKHKKRKKKEKSKKRKDHSRSRTRSPKIKKVPDTKVKIERVKSEPVKIKDEKVKTEVKQETKRKVSIKAEDSHELNVVINTVDASQIPMPDSPREAKLEDNDLRNKIDKKGDSCNDNDKGKSKIQIKNLKFSAVFEETVKKAEEEARKRAEKYEDGEYTDSSSSSVKEVVINTPFPKTSDPGGILKKAAEDIKIAEDEIIRSKKSKHKEKEKDKEKEKEKVSKRDSSKSRKRSRSRSRGSGSRRRPHRSGSRSRRRSPSKTRRRSRSRSRHRARHEPRHRGGRRSRSPSGVKLADSEKKRLLEVARRNAINMLKNGAVPAGAAALPPHTRNQVMAAIQSGGKSVDELTDFCKHLSKKEALGELSSVSSNDGDDEENEDTLAFHHPFLVKEKAPIVMNIRGGAPLPIKSTVLPIANKEELRLQFPVSSGTQHRDKAIEWVPVSPKKDKDNMQVAKLNSSTKAPSKSTTSESTKAEPLALPAPSDSTPPSYMKNFSTSTQLSTTPSVPLALPAPPGPQAYPPAIDATKTIDVAAIVSQKIAMIRREQEQSDFPGAGVGVGYGWSAKDRSLGQFTGSTGVNILTPRELASGMQAWAKKDQLVRAAPVEGGMGMALLQKMGWTPGQGLGKEGTGTLQPLLLEVKLDTKGLQAKEETAIRNNKGAKVFRKNTRGAGGPLSAGGKHPVSLLGEYCSKHKLGPPEYSLCFECGPDHKKNFLFRVKVAGIEYQPTVASQNKKQAKADSAQLALQKLGILI